MESSIQVRQLNLLISLRSLCAKSVNNSIKLLSYIRGSHVVYLREPLALTYKQERRPLSPARRNSLIGPVIGNDYSAAQQVEELACARAAHCRQSNGKLQPTDLALYVGMFRTGPGRMARWVTAQTQLRDHTFSNRRTNRLFAI